MQINHIPEGTKHIHLIGIGGIGVSALAPELMRRGYRVSGSDPAQNEVTQRLENMGVPISHQHRPENVADADLVVVSSAIRRTNPELLAAKERGIPVWQRAKMLGEILRKWKSIVITGAHGKTTITAMMTHVLRECGYDPTAFIGGDLPSIDGNIQLGDGEWAVAEGDESDGSFVHLNPDIAIINNIEADHLDFYKNIDEIVERFLEFIQGIREKGWLVLSADDERCRQLLAQWQGNFLTYGFSPSAIIRAQSYQPRGGGSVFEVYRRDDYLGEINLLLTGKINCHNALAVVAAGVIMQLPFADIVKALRSFSGVHRRMEVKGIVNDITIIDDYAHHPSEIRATIEALRDRYSGRMIGVFQPHLYSRTLNFMEDFSQSFHGLDLLVLTDIYPAREEPIPGISGEILVAPVRKQNVPVVYVPRMEEIPHFLKDISKPEDVVVTIGAGDIYQAGELFHEILSKKEER